MSKQVAMQIPTEAKNDLAVRSGGRHGSECARDSIASILVALAFPTMTADFWMYTE